MNPGSADGLPLNLEEQALLKEYELLESEINQRIRSSTLMLQWSVPLVLGITGYVYFEPAAPQIAFAGPFLVLIPSVYAIIRNVKATLRIATYVSVFMEPELGLGWESDLTTHHSMHKGKPVVVKSYARNAYLQHLLVALFIWVAFANRFGPWDLTALSDWVALLGVVLIPGVLIARAYFTGINREWRSEYLASWIAVRDDGTEPEDAEPAD